MKLWLIIFFCIVSSFSLSKAQAQDDYLEWYGMVGSCSALFEKMQNQGIDEFIYPLSGLVSKTFVELTYFSIMKVGFRAHVIEDGVNINSLDNFLEQNTYPTILNGDRHEALKYCETIKDFLPHQ